MLTNFFDFERDEAIVDVDVASDLHDLGDVLVVKPQGLLITFIHVLVVQGELDSCTLLQLNLGSATLNKTRRVFADSHTKNLSNKPSWSYLKFFSTHALDKSGPDFWSLGVQSDSHGSVVDCAGPKALSCLTHVLDGLGMVLHG